MLPSSRYVSPNYISSLTAHHPHFIVYSFHLVISSSPPWPPFYSSFSQSHFFSCTFSLLVFILWFLTHFSTSSAILPFISNSDIFVFSSPNSFCSSSCSSYSLSSSSSLPLLFPIHALINVHSLSFPLFSVFPSLSLSLSLLLPFLPLVQFFLLLFLYG